MESFASRSQGSRLIKYLKFFGILTLLVSALLLFLMVVIYTLPAMESYKYKQTTCVVDRLKVLSGRSDRQTCECKSKVDGTRCIIYFPCLQVFVNYTDNRNTVHKTMIIRHWRNIGEHCSYKIRRSECESEESVLAELESFRQRRGKRGQTYECFYKKGSRHVLLHNDSYDHTLVVHGTLWPAVGVLVGLMLIAFKRQIAGLCKKKGQLLDHIPLMEHET